MMGTGSPFTGVKWPRLGVDYLPVSGADIKNSVI
jgi:hypothetical protein